MSSNSGNTFSELLDANREQLESLYASVNIESPRADPHGKGAEVKVVRLTEETRDHLDDPIQWLEQHYGEKWRHEIRDRRVEGDEMLVLVRLELLAFGIRKPYVSSKNQKHQHKANHRFENANGNLRKIFKPQIL